MLKNIALSKKYLHLIVIYLKNQQQIPVFMKLLAFTFCSFLIALTVLPSAKAIKMTYFESCQMSCSSNDSDGDLPNGCGKEKCVLNFNLNSATFLVFSTDYQLNKEFISTTVKEKIQYHNNLKSNFSVTIWQPPENLIVT